MPKRIDQNQIEIVRTLRDVGISVAVTANQGGGFPDLVTGGSLPCPHCNKKFAQNKLVEIKIEKGTLTPAQKLFHPLWRGQIVVVRSVEEALRVHGIG